MRGVIVSELKAAVIRSISESRQGCAAPRSLNFLFESCQQTLHVGQAFHFRLPAMFFELQFACMDRKGCNAIGISFNTRGR